MTKAEKKAIANKEEKMVTREVKFYWWKSYKIWRVSGANIEEITRKAAAMSDKYHAIHFEVL